MVVAVQIPPREKNHCQRHYLLSAHYRALSVTIDDIAVGKMHFPHDKIFNLRAEIISHMYYRKRNNVTEVLFLGNISEYHASSESHFCIYCNINLISWKGLLCFPNPTKLSQMNNVTCYYYHT